MENGNYCKIMGYILGLYSAYGEENGNCSTIIIGYILGILSDNGKENGNCYIIAGSILGYIGITEKKMETTFQGLGFGA